MTTQDLEKRILQLESEVFELRKEIDSFTKPTALPRDLQLSLQRRGFINAPPSDNVGPDSGAREINLTGDPETIEVLGFPYEWRILEGTDLYLPLWKEHIGP